MTGPAPMREQILKAAEKRVRAGGFSEMSFRDVATDVGIKSASVHYHFPTKPDLGAALVEAYTQRFGARLEAIDSSHPTNALDAFIGLYADALVLDQSICLCAIMGAEAIGLPPGINDRTRAFFQMNLTWLQALFQRHTGNTSPGLSATIVSALEGAIIVASASGDRAIFDDVAQELRGIAANRLAPESG